MPTRWRHRPWQAAACGGTAICAKGRVVAAKALALTAIELFHNPNLILAAKKELERRRGDGFVYAPLLGDRAPALNYRD